MTHPSRGGGVDTNMGRGERRAKANLTRKEKAAPYAEAAFMVELSGVEPLTS